MGMQEVLPKLHEHLGDLADRIFERNAKRVYIDVPPEHALAANRAMIDTIEGRLATASGVDTRDRVEVLYHYCMDRDGIVVTVRTWAWKPDLEIDSLAQFLPGALFAEREIQDLLGVKFRGHPDPRRLILADDWPEGVYPLRRDFPAKVQGETIGPVEAEEPAEAAESKAVEQ